MKYIYTVIEKQAANEISLEINKNAQNGWELLSFAVAPFGTGLMYVAVLKAENKSS